jgi:eukaryotic-like serine/threonine-protein kinase
MSTISVNGPWGAVTMTLKSLFGYDVISEIGRGAASTIYAVTDPKSGQVYALKHVVRKVEKEQRYVAQVQNEFEVSKLVSHPTLRKVVELKQVKRFFGPVTEVALIMELIDGLHYDEKGYTELRRIVDVFIEVAKGLWEIHKAGYVHCDTKPGNIMITSDDRVKLIDLGQAAKVGTVKARVQGTPSFIAPEQARCKPLSEQTDVYNFGASLYWALTGKRVPTLLTVEKEDRGIVKEQRYPSPMELRPEMPASLSNIVMQCLRLRPSERVNGISGVLVRLEDCLPEIARA